MLNQIVFVLAEKSDYINASRNFMTTLIVLTSLAQGDIDFLNQPIHCTFN